MLDDDDLAVWIAGLDDLFALVASRFPRVEPRLQARAYVRGLLAPLAAKNSWTLAEAAGNKTPDRMQRLLNRAAWDDGGVRDDVRGYVARHLGDAGGVLIVDETGFVKKGTRSAGVQRQYSGTAGRVENCQLGVFLAYASPKGRALVDRELYLPKSWTDDRDRCREAGVPDDVQFASKTELARAMLGRALDAGMPASWVTADEAYGKDGSFRSWLEQRRIGYVVAVPKSQAVAGDAGKSRADVLTAHAPDQAWKRRSCGNGLQGPPGLRLGGRDPARRRHRAARLVPVPAGPPLPRTELQGRAGAGLLPVRRPGRHRRRGADPRRRGPLGRRGVLPERQERGRPRPLPGPPLRRLVQPRHPGRPRPRLPRRHRRERPKSPGSGLIPVTLAEVRRLLAHLITATPARTAAWAWSTWRRHHQHQARTSHYQRRQAQYNEMGGSGTGAVPH